MSEGALSRRRIRRPKKICRLVSIVMNSVLATLGLFLLLIGLVITHGSRTKVFGRVLEVLRHETSVQAIRPFAVICSVMGISLVVLSAFGSLSACLDNKPMIVFYLISVSVLTLAEITLIVMIIVHRKTVKELVEFILVQLHNRASEQWKYARTVLREVQRTFRCCGIKNPDDLQQYNLTCPHGDKYNQGCMIKISYFFNRNLICIIVICSLFFVFQVIALITSGGSLISV